MRSLFSLRGSEKNERAKYTSRMQAVYTLSSSSTLDYGLTLLAKSQSSAIDSSIALVTKYITIIVTIAKRRREYELHTEIRIAQQFLL